jgi:hypothetical protein
MWGACFGRGFRLVKQTAKWMNETWWVRSTSSHPVFWRFVLIISVLYLGFQNVFLWGFSIISVHITAVICFTFFLCIILLGIGHIGTPRTTSLISRVYIQLLRLFQGICTNSEALCYILYLRGYLTLYLLTWKIWWVPNNVSKWQMELNSSFKGLRSFVLTQRWVRNVVVRAICDSASHWRWMLRGMWSGRE